MHGFQLWINLPAREKMKPGSYRDVAPEEIPTAPLANGARARVLAGRLETADGAVAGPIQGVSTEPLFVDVAVPTGGEATLPLPAGHNAFVYVYQGTAGVGAAGTAVGAHQAALLSDGDAVQVTAADGVELRLLLLAARPLNEPVVQYGPFVMNSRDEIEQALADYQAGRLTD